MSATRYDVVIVGAGPIGLETAIRAKRAGLSYLVLEQGAIVNAIYHYPTYMTFFTTAERIEIGDHPLVSASARATRKESTDYYRKVVDREQLHIQLYQQVTSVERKANGFVITSQDPQGVQSQHHSHKLAIATGYFDNPKLLGVPGEDLPNVSHYYHEAHPFYNRPVTIIGAGSSAADAALDLYRAGAKVTMVHRGADFRHSLKYWIRPDLENRVNEGSITAHFNTVVKVITPDTVIAEKSCPEGNQTLRIPSVHTFALTGYYASPVLLQQVGISTDPHTHAATLDHDTFESDVPGAYVIGSAGFGTRTSDVFIENGLEHARKAVAHMAQQLREQPTHSQATTGKLA